MKNEGTPGSEETIFSAALQRAPLERVAYLNVACAGNPLLRQRVEKLLRAQSGLGEFMEDPPNGCAPTRGTDRPVFRTEEGVGSPIGRYKLLEQIGEGGCGVVYMAEQEEPHDPSETNVEHRPASIARRTGHIGIVADDGISNSAGKPLVALQPVLYEGNTFRDNQYGFLLLVGEPRTLESAPDVEGPWTPVAATLIKQNGQVTVTVLSNQEHGFFRIR